MRRKLSVIIPVYNEEESLNELYAQIMENINLCLSEQLLSSYELLFIDDGSADNSAQVMKELRVRDENVRYIIFRKNFGKSIALQAAFRNVSGDIVVTMDADLQDDPSELKNFLLKIDEGFDMVVGWKVNRLDPLEKKLPSKLFNKVTSKMSGLKLHDFDCGYKAFHREVSDSLDVYGEMHRYIPVMAYRNGFKITEIPVHHNKRKHGKSKYGMERYLRGLFDFLSVSYLSNFHDRPMYFFGKLGLSSFGIGFLICLYLTIEWFMGMSIGTRPLLQLGILLIFLGVQSLAIGFIGNMLVESTIRNNYSEAHIKEKV